MTARLARLRLPRLRRSQPTDPGALVTPAVTAAVPARAEVRESPEANNVTSCPRRTSSSVSVEITRSVPP